MPLTPTNATLAIRAAATINQGALDSVDAELVGQLAEVDTWAATPAKGLMRDHLNRVRSCARELREGMRESVRLANVVLSMFGTGGVDPAVPPITWSTGDW